MILGSIQVLDADFVFSFRDKVIMCRGNPLVNKIPRIMLKESTMGMDSAKLSKRSKQPGHDATFRKSEQDFVASLRLIFEGQSEWVVKDHPRDLSKMIDGVYGVVPEASLQNTRTKKIMYFEVKKQGDRGNADERACKHHTLQFQKRLKAFTKMPFHAFVTVMCEALATNPRYTVKHLFYFEEDAYVNWVNYDVDILEAFLRKHVIPKLSV
jgi:hypothetical protein